MQDATQRHTQRIQTHQFGVIDIEPHQIFTFSDGLIGFTHLTEFVLINDDSTAPIQWLMSLQDATIGLPVINALLIDPQYKPALEADAQTQTVYVVVNLSGGNIRINMKAPIIVSSATMQGEQIVLSSERYQTDYTLQTQHSSVR
jgi:flagellar assembly factor FliW